MENSERLEDSSFSDRDIFGGHEGAYRDKVSIPETFPLPVTQDGVRGIDDSQTPDRYGPYGENGQKVMDEYEKIPETFPLPETQVRTVFSKEVPSFPSNSSMESSGLGTTVIFKQNDLGTKKLSQDPISIAKFFENILPAEEIKDIRMNRRLNIVKLLQKIH